MKTARLRGALFALIAFTLYACGDALVKVAGLDNIPPALIVMISGYIAALTILFYSIASKNIGALRPKKWKKHAVLIAVFIAQAFISIEAFTNLPLTTVYIGLFASPFILAFISSTFMNEPISRKQSGAVALGFGGVILALVPEFLSAGRQALGDPIVGYIALPFFVITYISAMLLLRIMGRTETPESITFVSMLGRGVILTPALFFIPVMNIPLEAFLYMIGVGICVGFGFLLMSRAYQLAPVAIVSPFHYSQLIVGAIFGYLIWQTTPSIWVFIGGTLIIASGLMITHEAHKQGQKEDPKL